MSIQFFDNMREQILENIKGKGKIKMSNNRHEFIGSSSIAACDYDEEKGEMIIHFLSGGSHKYKCDKSVYEGLKASPSPGKHFHAHIRKQHKSEKI